MRRLLQIGGSAALASACVLSGCTTTKTVTVVKTVAVTPSPAAASATGDPSALGDDASDSGASSSPATDDSTGTGDSADAAVDPCQLLTQAEAGTLSGVTMLAGHSVTGQSCEYDTDPNGATSQVTIFLDSGAKQTYDLDTSLGHAFTPIPGLGDAAYLETGAAFARKGNRWVQVSDSFLEDAAADDARLKAALTVAAGRFFANR